MPELPEVESFCKYMQSTSLNKKISNVIVQSKTVLTKNLSPHILQTKLNGCRFVSAKGYGKYLFAETDKGDFLVIHFGMTGYLNYYKNPDDATRFIRMQINFNNGYHLAYDDGRKLGRIYLAEDFKQFIKKKRLGIDPIREKINYSRFKEILNGKRGSVKTLLMKQEVFAGIGNIYSDEILFQSNIHPASPTNKLNDKNLKLVFKKMKAILNKAINANADWENISDKYLIHFRKANKDCPVCSGKIKKSTIGGRSSYYCNKHQKLIK